MKKMIYNYFKVIQHYPPGTQEIYNSFSSRNFMMKNSNELESSEARGGGKGSGIREADSDDRWFPLKLFNNICSKF
jgi:hypothetical protein